MKTFEITIREETTRKLGLDKNPTFSRSLKTAIEIFCGYNFADASYVIFKLMYENDKDVHNKILKKFGFTLYSEESFDPCIEYLFIEEDTVPTIAEELQFQYMKDHPHFLKVKTYPNCEEELNELQSLLAKHPLLLYRAVESAWYSHKDSTLVQSCVYLLLSGKTESQLKGLEKLSHNHKHQQLLLPYAKEIGMLLRAMNTEHTEKQRVLAAQKELDAINKPFASLGKLLEGKVPSEGKVEHKEAPALEEPETKFTEAEAPISEPDSQKVADNSTNTECSVSEELSKLLDNKDALTFSIPNADEFWKQMAKLRGIGIDLNFLVDNLQTVIGILYAHVNLETAATSLGHAKHEHSVAMELYTKRGDRESLQGFIKAAGIYQEAKDLYKEAQKNFVEHCQIFEKSVAKAS